jgi:hypothetical protein
MFEKMYNVSFFINLLEKKHRKIGYISTYNEINKSNLLTEDEKINFYMSSFQAIHTMEISYHKLYKQRMNEWHSKEINTYLPHVYYKAWLNYGNKLPANSLPGLSHGEILKKPEPILNAVSYFLDLNREELKKEGLVTSSPTKLKEDAMYNLNILNRQE